MAIRAVAIGADAAVDRGATFERGARAPAVRATLVIATNTEYLGACPVIASQNQGGRFPLRDFGGKAWTG